MGMNPDDLRKIADDPRYPGTDIVAACRQAADEIERLRYEVADSFKKSLFYKGLYESNAADTFEMVRQRGEAHKRAEAAEAKLERYRKALEWIECSGNWHPHIEDALAKAREALADAAEGVEKS